MILTLFLTICFCLKKILSCIPLVGKTLLRTCLGFGTLCILLSLALIYIDWVQICTTQLTKVKDGSPLYNYLREPKERARVSVYLFNITNHEKFILNHDSKLKVEEVGPFIYKEILYYEDFYVEDGLMKYSPRTDLTFVREGSVGDPHDVTVTMPNLALLDLTAMLSPMNSSIRAGWHLLTSKINSKAIVTTTVSRFLTQGNPRTEPLAWLAYNVIPDLLYLEHFGFFARFYHQTTPTYLEMSNEDEDKFSVKNWFSRRDRIRNGTRYCFSYGECQESRDFTSTYEGIGYPPGITPDFSINLLRNGFCKPLPMVFHKKVVLDDGLKGFFYNLSDDFFTGSPYGFENGLLETYFYKVTTTFSKVRFQGVEPELYEKIELKTRDPKENGYIIVEPHVALNLKTYFPIQLNIKLGDLDFLLETRPLSNMLIPIGYIESVQPPLAPNIQETLRLMYVVVPMILLGIAVFLMALGVLLIMFFFKSIIKRNSMRRNSISSDTEILLIDKHK